ncbi:MAG: hypothetical protein ACXACI_01795 [Candidatus Hodarchaeales archaeon]
MTSISDIARLEMAPVVETETPNLQGFYVKGFKGQGRRKTGFLVSGVRSINVEQLRPRRVRTRIMWGPENQSFEVEEHVSMAMRRAGSILSFKVPFDESKEPITIRGRVDLSKNGFEGESISLQWQQDKIILKASQEKNFTCRLKRKQRTIEITLEE